MYEYNSLYTIAESIITENTHGIVSQFSSPLITRNSITNNSGFGISNSTSSSSFIAENLIKGNGYDGIYTYASSPIIRENTVTMNGISNGMYDISSSTPNISFNVYDTIIGTTGVGQFNVKSDGSLAPAP
ncbi:MAG TPA: hypothetical protein DHU69_05180 [Deltaproteobacteria bacterium]|nr:hypothetical protein [Deltaproteobacteria bacterium]HCY19148.1 hypothetical protein [Deltaproteobacteria bacterium]